MGKVKSGWTEALDGMNDVLMTMTLFDPNKDPVYSIPLSQLVNLWRAKFGDTWVDVSEIDDDFWSDASARLHTNKKMEELNHHTGNTPWARLKEDRKSVV
jgi:hypothetical protein